MFSTEAVLSHLNAQPPHTSPPSNNTGSQDAEWALITRVPQYSDEYPTDWDLWSVITSYVTNKSCDVMRDVSTQDIQTPPTPVSCLETLQWHWIRCVAAAVVMTVTMAPVIKGRGARTRDRHHAFVKLILHIFTLINRGRSSSAVPLKDPGNNIIINKITKYQSVQNSKIWIEYCSIPL